MQCDLTTKLMKVYILPSEKDKFVHKLSLMSKHLEKMPRVEFSEPKWMKKKTTVIYDKGRDEYGGFTYITFKNKEGILFGKSFTSTRTLESDCKNPDETYSFSAKCVYIDDRKRMVKLGGRISRIK